jgi:excisionase family DNA binding protein
MDNTPSETITNERDTTPYDSTTNSYEAFSSYGDVLTVKDLQSALQIGRSTAYKLLQEGEISSIRIGDSYRIPKRYLIDYVYGSCYNNGVVASGLTVLKEVSR